MLLQARSRRSATRFVAVRFGNVLGSDGSVIPLFQKQIARGGPITVTHPEARRYFMTIPESVRLVLQAASMGRGGEVFLLDMGEQVRIVDLARQLIRMQGLREGEDIEIVFTGLRPGEKLHEQLVDDYELSSSTALAGVFRITPRAEDAYLSPADVAHLETIARTLPNAVVRQRVFAYLDQCLSREERAVG
jgi:FlaA1/EpsC-like NDP-sugar epimerase